MFPQPGPYLVICGEKFQDSVMAKQRVPLFKQLKQGLLPGNS